MPSNNKIGRINPSTANKSIDPSKSSKPLGGHILSDEVERQLNAMAHITYPLAWKYDLPVDPEVSIALEA